MAYFQSRVDVAHQGRLEDSEATIFDHPLIGDATVFLYRSSGVRLRYLR